MAPLDTTEKAIRVLLVEDSRDDADALVRVLERGDYQVAFARVETAEAMRVALEQQAWDLVLSDFSLPCFSAPRALSLLQGTGLDLPFIIVSGTVPEEQAIEVLKAGAHDFVLKDQLARFLPAVERGLREAVARRDLRQAEQARREAEVKYRQIVENTLDGVWILDANLRTTYMSRRMAKLLELEAPGDAPAAEFIGHDDGVDAGNLQFLLEDVPHSRQLKVRRRDGSFFWASMSVCPIPSDSQGGPGTLLLVRDVTEYKQMQEQLRQAQKMEALGQLAGGVAHDFNNLLTVVLGNAEMVCEELHEDNPHRQEMVEIQKAGQQAADLTRRLLAFSRKQILQPVILDINTVINNAFQMLRRLLGANIDCVAVLDDNLEKTEVDPGQVEQVLMNLVLNARDAMPDGGRLTIRTASVQLDESFVRTHVGARPGHYVMLEVSDTGVGIDEATQLHIFEPFFTTKGPGKGTGLGLAIIYGIVKQSAGYISVESNPGAGATFKVYLPRAARAAAAMPEQTARTAAGAGGSETVLLVEDAPPIRLLVETALVRSGYRVVAAPNPKEALALLQRHPCHVDLLVTDVAMPEASGLDLYRLLKPTRPYLKVLYTSGYIEEGIVRQAVREPGTAFLPKPFTPTALAMKVRQVLDDQSPGLLYH